MNMPVSNHYLSNAIVDGLAFKDMALYHHHIGEIALPTGQLVSCDPFVFPETEPFTLTLPRGTFPVVLSVAKFATDQRVAFAVVRFRQSTPIVWDMLTVGDQDKSNLEPDHFFGYPVDAGTGCFMDRSTGLGLAQQMNDDYSFYETMIAEMDKTYVHTWSWLDMRFGDGNLIAFSSGYGDGLYATYVGFDTDGEVSVIVTDFGVAPPDNNVA